MEEKDVDPVEELHRIRKQICKEAGGTTEDYLRYYLEMDREKVAASKIAEAAKPARANTVQSKRSRKSTKPAVKASARQQRQRRKAVTA